jgi:hypothetical protein
MVNENGPERSPDERAPNPPNNNPVTVFNGVALFMVVSIIVLEYDRASYTKQIGHRAVAGGVKRLKSYGRSDTSDGGTNQEFADPLLRFVHATM